MAEKARGRPPVYTDDQIALGLVAAGGVLAATARWLTEKYGRRLSRPAVSARVRSSAKLQSVLNDVHGAVGDHCEALLWQRIEQGCEKSLHFILATKYRDRGY